MKFLTITYFIFFGFYAQGQDLDLRDFRWENRILLFISEDSNNTKYQKQLFEFIEKEDGMSERKLLIVEVQKNRYRLHGELLEWNESSSLYKEYANDHNDFQVLLIGLDGGIKLRQKEMVTAKEIFDKIDSMPMRMSEIRRKGN